ncbi:MAG: hypothetical protein H0T53_04830 [Herpetosiphonaceae bacterium]|nr:hypothetical protein [Herpetosiphonaceae bacterium]
MTEEIWNILHDGVITQIQGAVPGDITLQIKIAYLRTMFSADGDSIMVNLSDCTLLSYDCFEEAAVLSVPELIAVQEPVILRVTSADQGLLIVCVGGDLALAYSDYQLALDNGRTISLAELDAACVRYWDTWEQENIRRAQRSQ